MPLILVMVLLLFLAGSGVVSFRSASVTGKRSHVQAHLPQDDTPDAFVKKLARRPGASVDAAGHITVKLSINACYRLYSTTTYQELAVLDSSLLRQIVRQLDAQGIEYEVLKNNSNVVLLTKGEWLVNWGGLLFVPEIPVNF